MGYAKEFIYWVMSVKVLELYPELRELNSGRMSPHFFDAGKFEKGALLATFAKYYADAILANLPKPPDVVFGPSYKGSAIAVAVSMALGQNIGWAYDRKEAKTHGEKGIIVGEALKDKIVAIVDDVITSGESLSRAVEVVWAQGGTPIGCFIAFDRQERGKDTPLSAVQEFEQRYKIPLKAVANLETLIEVLPTLLIPDGPEMLQEILAYKEKWGAKI